MKQHPLVVDAGKPSRWTRLGFMTFVALTTASCGGSFFESSAPVPTRYIIAPAPAAQDAVASAASSVDLAISNPDVAPGLESARVAVLRGRVLDYYRTAQWGGSVQETVQALLVATLQDQKLFRSVTADQARVSSTYVLDCEVRDFQAEYTDGKAAPEVRVTLIGRVIRIADRYLVETVSATALRPAKDNRMTAVAAAFEAAAQQVALQLAQSTATIVAKDATAVAAAARQ